MAAWLCAAGDDGLLVVKHEVIEIHVAPAARAFVDEADEDAFSA